MVNYANFLSDFKNNKQELFDLLSSLVNIDSQNLGTTGREKNLAEYFAEYIIKLGYKPDIFSPDDMTEVTDSPDYLPGHNLKDRPCVCTVIPGSNHAHKYMLAAHLDTVSVGDVNAWRFNPFSGLQKNGKIYGRGAGDDKSGLAICLYIIEQLNKKSIILPFDLIIAAYCDEENGGGNGALACSIRYPCDGIINLDGLTDNVWVESSGGSVVTAYIKADNTLDSSKLMLYGLNILSEELDHFHEKRALEFDDLTCYKNTNLADTCVRYNEIIAGINDTDKDSAHIMFTFYTTCTKQEIEYEFNIMVSSINSRLNKIGIHFERFEFNTRFFHYEKAEENGNMLRAFSEAGKEITGKEIPISGSCLSDFSIFLKYGSKNSITCGAIRPFDQDGGAHQPNEYIEMSSLIETASIVALTLLKLK